MKIIYHTSHCGSTLLTALLAQNNVAYAEPDFSALIGNEKDIGYAIKETSYKNIVDYLQYTPKFKNIIMKLTTKANMTAVFNKRKKVFLYNNLKRHIYKFIRQNRIDLYHPDYYYLYSNTTHPKLSYEFEKNHMGQEHASQVSTYMWAHSMLWLLECKNVLWVNSEEFFFDRVKTVNMICDYLEVEKPHDYFPKNYVDKQKYFDKGLPMNHKEAYLNKQHNEITDIETDHYDNVKEYALKHYKLLEPYFENEKHLR